MPRYGDEFKRSIVNDLAGLTGRERAEAVRRLASFWKVSEQAISTWCVKAGRPAREQPRRDRGQSRATEETIREIASALLMAKRSDGRLPMHTKDAARILIETGGIETDVSYSTLCRELRRHDLSKPDLRRRTPYRSRAYAHPNWEWQIDASNCIQYFFDTDGLSERDIAMQLHKNHPAEFRKIRRELLRYVAIDPYSGCFVFRYFYETGERAKDFLDFLIDLWQPPERWNRWRTPHPAFQFHGVPNRLLADKGAFAKSDMVKRFLAQCDVDLITHLPGNPRAKGFVEGQMNHVEAFEVWLKAHPAPDPETLNRWAWEWACRKNCEEIYRAKTDPRRLTRLQRWLTIAPEQLRVPAPADVLWAILRDGRMRRKVEDNGRVEYKRRWYRVPDTNAWGRWVEVAYNPLTYPEVDVTWQDREDGRVLAIWRLQPLDQDAGGFLSDCAAPGTIRQPAATRTQQAMAELERRASERYGVSWKGTGDKRIAVRPALGQHKTTIFGQGRDAEAVEGLATLPKAGTPHEIKDPAAERRLTVVELLQAVRNALGRPLAAHENTQIRTGWPEGCRQAEVEAVLDACAGARREGHDEDRRSAMGVA